MARWEEEIEKLGRGVDDLRSGVEQEVKGLDVRIRATKREAKCEASLKAKVAAQRRSKDPEAQRNRKRRVLFEAHDEADGKREGLIADVETYLRQEIEVDTLLTIRWRVVLGRGEGAEV